jgi:hypothetical protein
MCSGRTAGGGKYKKRLCSVEKLLVLARHALRLCAQSQAKRLRRGAEQSIGSAGDPPPARGDEKQVAAVVLGGKLLPKAALREMLEKVEAFHRK